MYTPLILVAWLYVALMAAVAEAGNAGGTVLGAIITFVLYGLLPVGILGYILFTPIRKRAMRARQMAESQAPSDGVSGSPVPPDASGHAPADAIPPVGKEP